MARSSDVIDTLCDVLLGFAYQVLGDAALAAQAANTVCVALWRAVEMTSHSGARAVEVIHEYLARGFVVRPLQPEGPHAALLSALQKLDPVERMIVLLRYHEGIINFRTGSE